MASNNICLGFNVEWFDPLASLLHHMQLKYFISDGTIEILEKDKCFLKRIYYPEVKLEHLFIGGSVTVYNRLLSIKSYCNVATEKYMAERETHILCIFASAAAMGQVLSFASRCGYRTGHVKTAGRGFLSSDGLEIEAGSVLYELVGAGGADQLRQLQRDATSIRGVRMVGLSAEAVLVSAINQLFFNLSIRLSN